MSGKKDTPDAGYVAEDGKTPYVAEDGVTPYATEEWGGSTESHVTVLDKKHAHERFNRWLDLGVAILYFVIIAIVIYWRPSDLSAKDILSLINLSNG